MKDKRDRREEIIRGMRLAADLPDIMPDEADERIKPIYEDIQRTLRVPITNLIFRTLANYPNFLITLWEKLSPSFRTDAFEQHADRLRREALLEPVPEVSGVDWEKIEGLDRQRAFNDTIHYVLPKLLLVATAFDASAFGSDSTRANKNGEGGDSPEIPLGAADGTTKVEMIDLDKASDRVRDLFNAIKERHGHPLVSSYFRGLGNWPDFLDQAWTRLSPIVGSSEYEERKYNLIEQGETIVCSMGVPKMKETGLYAEQASDVGAILTAFRLKFIPEMLLDAVLIKAMLDGIEEASSSRFSVAGQRNG